MKSFCFNLTNQQYQVLKKHEEAFIKDIKNIEGWGCIANINCVYGVVNVGMFTPQEFKLFLKSWETVKSKERKAKKS